jgi:hypothetical protein
MSRAFIASALAACASATTGSRVFATRHETWGVAYLPGGAKLVNVTAGGEQLAYVLTVRGAAPPPLSALAGLLPAGARQPVFLETPLRRVGMLSTTQIQFAEVRPWAAAWCACAARAPREKSRATPAPDPPRRRAANPPRSLPRDPAPTSRRCWACARASPPSLARRTSRRPACAP